MDDYNNDIANKVISEFAKETPSELELIATALYVYVQNRDVHKIKSDVIKIKGTKYTEKRIDDAIHKLEKAGYIAA